MRIQIKCEKKCEKVKKCENRWKKLCKKCERNLNKVYKKCWECE